MKKISVVVPVFNEESNVENLYNSVKAILKEFQNLTHEIIFIDNASIDSSREIIRKLAQKDKDLKAIFNTRNFGYIKSPYYALINSSGDASILMVCDFQEPPELIRDFINEWHNGFKIVLGIKDKADNNFFLRLIKHSFYNFLNKFSETSPVPNSTGFGLYDKSVINHLKKLDDPYPFLRGLIAQTGYPIKKIFFQFNPRISGESSSNISILYDYMILGLIYHTKIPLRLIFLIGFLISLFSFIILIIYIILKIFFWYDFDFGFIPIIISILFFGGLQMLFLGIVAEYISYIITKLDRFPLVIESERINFD